ncbi:MAG: DUF3794 domain-containing protein [Clostridia bacterium]|nr:DUF3794 domain-containing protein [Clostridia bacterium]
MDNYIKVDKGGARIQDLLCDRQNVTELAGDFSLPDYQPEIKRLLRVRATVSPPDKYIGAGSADFSGMIDYCILYAGNDGALYCVNRSEEYQFSTPVEMTSDFELGDGLTCDVQVLPDMVVGRVAAPRKLSVKCRLRSRVKLFGTRIIEESMSGGDGTGIQRLLGNADCARIFVGQGEPLQLGDEIICESSDDDLRVICAEGQVFVTEAVAGSGCVNCRGEVALKLLCCHESGEGSPKTFLRRIPFNQAVPVEGAEVNCDACAHGVCSDISVTVEDGRILCDLTLKMSARAQRNESFSYTRDVYSTAAECESRYLSRALSIAGKCINGNMSLNTTLTLEEAGIKGGYEVLDICATPVVTDLECEKGKTLLTGKCRCHVILSGEGELSAQEFEIPFRYETDAALPNGEKISDYDATADVISCRARLDGERIGVDAELSVSLATRGETQIKMLTDTCFGEPLARSKAVYTICYPSREDTLWSVAKRYHCPVSDVFERNGLSGAPAADSRESLAGVSYLLV